MLHHLNSFIFIDFHCRSAMKNQYPREQEVFLNRVERERHSYVPIDTLQIKELISQKETYISDVVAVLK